MEFPLFSHSVSLSHSIFVFDCENKYSEFRFYSHALVSMNNEGCWFCENKNDDTTHNTSTKNRNEKRSKKMVTSEESVQYGWSLSPSLYFSSVFFVCFFPVVFYRWFFDSKPFFVCERIHSVCSTRVSQTKSSHFLTAFDLILLSRQFYLFVCEQIATLTRTRTHSKIKCNHFQFLLSYTVTVPCECLCHFLIYGISTSRNDKKFLDTQTHNTICYYYLFSCALESGEIEFWTSLSSLHFTSTECNVKFPGMWNKSFVWIFRFHLRRVKIKQSCIPNR